MNAKIKLFMVIAVFMTSCLTSMSLAEDPVDTRVKFRKLVLDRNKLHSELQVLDKQSAEALKSGKSTTKINSRQVTVQDKLDLLTLRLETMAVRYDYDMPALPSDKDGKGAGAASSPVKKVEFERGHKRTLAEVKKQTLRMLASINFDSITARTFKE